MFGVLEPVSEQPALEAAAAEATAAEVAARDAEIERLREENMADANRFSTINRDLQRRLRDEKKITDGVLSARQIGTVAAVAEQGTKTAAAVKAAEAAAAVKAAASAETAAALEAAVKTAEIAAAVKAAEAAASVRMATAVEAAVKAAEAAASIRMATAVEAAVKAAEAAAAVEMAAAVEAAVKTLKSQLKELQVTHKGRSERAVALEKATAAMTLAQLKKELESRGMCSYGRLPDLKQRLVLELAGRCQSDSIGLHSAAAAAVTAAICSIQKNCSHSCNRCVQGSRQQRLQR